MSKILKKNRIFILLGFIIVISFFFLYKNKKEDTSDIFIGTTYSVDSIDKIVIFNEKNTRIYEEDEDIQLIIDSLKLVRLTHLQGMKDSNGWIYNLRVYVDDQVVDTILVHNYMIKYNQESYKSEKNIVLVLDNVLDKINE